MKAHQNFTFQDRVDQVNKAKQRALDQLRAKPPVDPAVQEERLVAGRKREAAEAEKRLNRKTADEAAAKAVHDAAIASEEAEAMRLAAIKPEPTAEERKLVRDAKYAARKKRR